MIDELEKNINPSDKNTQMSLRQAAEEVGISVTTLYHKVKKLEKSGVLKEYIPLIDKDQERADITQR